MSTPKETKPNAETTTTTKAVVIEPAKLEAEDVAACKAYTDNLVVLMKAEETHNTTAINLIDMFEAKRQVMVEAGLPKKDIPMKIFEALRILLDADEALDEKVVTRAKKEILHITQYFQLQLEMRIRDIRFTLFSKVVGLTQSGDISKSSVKNALKKTGEAYPKALEALVTKAEYAKLVGSINMALIPQELQDTVNNLNSKETLTELAKLVKVQSQKVAV